MKITLRVVAIAGGLLLVATAAYIRQARAFDSFHAPTVGPCARPGLQVRLVGDSWVAGRKLDQSLIDAAAPRAVELQSHGFPGATSRDVYRRLQATPAILSCADAVVVVVGVNDTGGHRGADFYAHHVTLIARLALALHVSPFVVAVPQYDLAHLPMSMFGRRRLFALLFDGPDPISEYRDALRQRVEAERLAVTVVAPHRSPRPSSRTRHT